MKAARHVDHVLVSGNKSAEVLFGRRRPSQPLGSGDLRTFLGEHLFGPLRWFHPPPPLLAVGVAVAVAVEVQCHLDVVGLPSPANAHMQAPPGAQGGDQGMGGSDREPLGTIGVGGAAKLPWSLTGRQRRVEEIAEPRARLMPARVRLGWQALIWINGLVAFAAEEGGQPLT